MNNQSVNRNGRTKTSCMGTHKNNPNISQSIQLTIQLKIDCANCSWAITSKYVFSIHKKNPVQAENWERSIQYVVELLQNTKIQNQRNFLQNI